MHKLYSKFYEENGNTNRMYCVSVERIHDSTQKFLCNVSDSAKRQ